MDDMVSIVSPLFPVYLCMGLARFVGPRPATVGPQYLSSPLTFHLSHFHKLSSTLNHSWFLKRAILGHRGILTCSSQLSPSNPQVSDSYDSWSVFSSTSFGVHWFGQDLTSWPRFVLAFHVSTLLQFWELWCSLVSDLFALVTLNTSKGSQGLCFFKVFCLFMNCSCVFGA